MVSQKQLFISYSIKNRGSTPNETISETKFDYILASDCVYLESTFDILIDSLKTLIPESSTTRLIISSKKRRRADRLFFLKLKKVFDMVLVDQSVDGDSDEWRRNGISIFYCSRKIKK